MRDKINIKEQDVKMKVTEEQSKQVQEICFRLGIYWYGETYGYNQFETEPYLFIRKGKLTTTDDTYYFTYIKNLEVSAEQFIRTKGFTENITEESLTESEIEDLEQSGTDKVGLRKGDTEEIKQEDKPKNNFKEYGFEADFEGEILKELEWCYIGYFLTPTGKTPYSARWSKERGICYPNKDYSLTPIKNPWYKTPNQFRLIMLRKSNGWYPNIFYSEDYLEVGISNMETTEGKIWRYATKEEIYSLYQGEEGENNE